PFWFKPAPRGFLGLPLALAKRRALRSGAAMATGGCGVARPFRRSPEDRKAGKLWARQSADRAIIKLSDELRRVQADFEAIICGLTTIFGCAELADRIVALAPALGEKLAGRMPSAAQAVRRNVALHSDARGVRVSTAPIEQLRRLQKYGARLEARAEAECFTFNADAAELFRCGSLGTCLECLPLPGVLGYSESGSFEAVEGSSVACAGDGGGEHDVGPAGDVPSKVITPEFFAAGRKSSSTSAPSLGLCPVEGLRQGGGVPVRAVLPGEPLRADSLPDLLAGPGPAAEGGCCSTLDELLEAEVLKYEELEAARASPRALGAGSAELDYQEVGAADAEAEVDTACSVSEAAPQASTAVLAYLHAHPAALLSGGGGALEAPVAGGSGPGAGFEGSRARRKRGASMGRRARRVRFDLRPVVIGTAFEEGAEAQVQDG
ncbi:unnamed protein product, partial [Prorocentrum cordatum]